MPTALIKKGLIVDIPIANQTSILPGARNASFILIMERLSFILLIFLLGCQELPPSFMEKALNADDHPDEWLLNGRDFKGQHFSPLNDINQATVAQLGLAWHIDLPRDGGQESIPLMVDGVLYFTAAWSVVHAVDAATGKELWVYDPEVPKATQAKGCCGPVNRGVAYYNEKVYVGAFDGRLIALDASSGQELWVVNTLDHIKNYSSNFSYTITGAPRIAKDKIVIGNGGGEFGVRGFVTAYDAETGAQAWRFYTIPGDPSEPFENPILEMAAETWHGEWWKVGGGGTVWDDMVYDPETDLFYIGVGNSSPYNPNIRTAGKGDNLFLSSIVALHAEDGSYAWHYQSTPGEAWDYTATQHMILAELPIEGQQRKVLMQAPKNGFFYILDRQTGELLSAEKFSKVTWASHIDMATGRPVVNDAAKYWETGKPAQIFPSRGGAHNWYPMSFSPQTGLVYIPEVERSGLFIGDDQEPFLPIGRNMGLLNTGRDFPKDPAILSKFLQTQKGHLIAWNPVEQKAEFKVEHRFPDAGGILSTAGGLVFQGTFDGFFQAFDDRTGEKLWTFDAQTPIRSAPMTFRIDGAQYIAVTVGRGGTGLGGRQAGNLGLETHHRSRILCFKLNGKQKLPQPGEEQQILPDWTDLELDQERILPGAKLWQRHCLTCHGFSAVGNSIVPDLRYSAYAQEEEAWYSVVGKGILEPKGMIGFQAIMNPEEIESIRHYLIHHNRASRVWGDTIRLGR